MTASKKSLSDLIKNDSVMKYLLLTSFIYKISIINISNSQKFYVVLRPKDI